MLVYDKYARTLSRDEQGYWNLGVHIADVSHFVRPGSVIDQTARKRGTSVYLPDRVIPMLPEVLSNSLASLQAGKVRYTVSALLQFNAEGVRTEARRDRRRQGRVGAAEAGGRGRGCGLRDVRGD